MDLSGREEPSTGKETLSAVNEVMENTALLDNIKSEKELAEKNGSYAACIQYYYENFVIKESAPDFLEKLDPEHLKKHLSRNESGGCL